MAADLSTCCAGGCSTMHRRDFHRYLTATALTGGFLGTSQLAAQAVTGPRERGRAAADHRHASTSVGPRTPTRAVARQRARRLEAILCDPRLLGSHAGLPHCEGHLHGSGYVAERPHGRGESDHAAVSQRHQPDRGSGDRWPTGRSRFCGLHPHTGQEPVCARRAPGAAWRNSAGILPAGHVCAIDAAARRVRAVVRHLPAARGIARRRHLGTPMSGHAIRAGSLRQCGSRKRCCRPRVGRAPHLRTIRTPGDEP